jgi:imidazolonepropionase-like amidohydrolase
MIDAREKVAYVASRVVDGTGAPALSDATVVVEDGRIVDVLVGTGESAPPGCRVVRLPGCTLLPGLIDAHVHLTFSPDLAEDGSVQADLSSLSAEQLMLRALRNARLALSGGVTTMRDLGGPGLTTLRLRDAIAGGEVVGPRLLVAGESITTTAGHGWFFGTCADSVDEVRKAVRRLCQDGVDVIKVMVTGGMMTLGSNFRAPQFSDEELQTIVDEAHRLGRRVAGHILCSAGVRAAIRAGFDTIEHGWTITGKTQDYEPGLAESIAEHGIFGSVTAQRDLRGLLPHRLNDLDELTGRLGPHREMLRAGVSMVVHSDAGPPGTRFERFAESVEVFMRGLGVSVEAAIRAATGTAAEALGIDERVGTVAVGKDADLLVVEGDVTSDIAALRQVRLVTIAGRTVVKGGTVLERFEGAAS